MDQLGYKCTGEKERRMVERKIRKKKTKIKIIKRLKKIIK
jgi:hypothetical protein